MTVSDQTDVKQDCGCGCGGEKNQLAGTPVSKGDGSCGCGCGSADEASTATTPKGDGSCGCGCGSGSEPKS